MQTQIIVTFKCFEIGLDYKMNGVLGHDSAFVRLYWVGDNLG